MEKGSAGDDMKLAVVSFPWASRQILDTFGRTAPSARHELSDFNASDAHIQWQRFCELSWHHDDLGVWLDISRMHVNATDLQQLQPRMEKAFAAMQELEAGAIANPDEQRQVGHYWLRTPELAPSSELQQHISREIDLIAAFGRDVINGTIKAPTAKPSPMCSGSASAAVAGTCLDDQGAPEPGRGASFHFFDNVDPNGMSNVLAGLEGRLDRTLVVTVSKSGGRPNPTSAWSRLAIASRPLGASGPARPLP